MARALCGSCFVGSKAGRSQSWPQPSWTRALSPSTCHNKSVDTKRNRMWPKALFLQIIMASLFEPWYPSRPGGCLCYIHRALLESTHCGLSPMLGTFTHSCYRKSKEPKSDHQLGPAAVSLAPVYRHFYIKSKLSWGPNRT